MKRILITGVAGFIGFHLAQALSARGDFVIGLDNFNAYYDPQLKKRRAELLDNPVIEGDICDKEKLRLLLVQNQITHVVHLAAQAGVRHSIHQPQEYVEANIQGFVSLMEALSRFPKIQLVYASSSSVYGANTKIPFSVEDQTDSPTNLYGATKKANELIAAAYHHLYGIPSVGLRYFTVYGPWGRPDMAYYRFAQRIVNQEPIEIFGEGKMLRDFTYIDDIIDGTLRALDLGGALEIFNLGAKRPIELMEFIFLLEKNLKMEAIKTFLPMQQGEVVATYADIEKSERLLGFSPKISIEEGISRFVDWFQLEAANFLAI